MPAMIDAVMDRLGGENLSQLSRAVGADESTTRDGLRAAVPAILAGLARNASSPDGASRLDGALAQDHDGGLLDRVGDFLGQGDTSPGDGILRHVFGDRRDVMERGVSQTTGLDKAQAGKLIAMAAPLVMAWLGRQKRERQLDAGSLSRELERENREVVQREPGLGGLAGLLDRDRDGSVADDVVGGLGRIFGR